MIPTTATTVLGGTALMGFLVAAWGKIKVYLFKIYSLMIETVKIEDKRLYFAVCTFLHEEFKCSKIGAKVYDGGNYYIRPLEKNQFVGYRKIPQEPTIWRRGLRFFIVSQNGNEGPGSSSNNMTLTFPRFMWKPDEVIAQVVNKINDRENGGKSGRFRVMRFSGTIAQPAHNDPGKESKAVAESSNSDWHIMSGTPMIWQKNEIGQPHARNAMDFLALKKPVLDAVGEARRWFASEKWFKERKIPWKRGWNIFGGPGTGKTAFVRALGQELDIPIISFDLSTMTNQDFIRLWKSALDESPCIALLEDIDNIFHGRENVAVKSGGMHQGLTFDCLLNEIDGVENTDGLFLIITTNHIEYVDPALGNPNNGDEMSTRPGRIDRLVEFTPLDAAGREKLATRIFAGFDRAIWTRTLKEGEKDTGAQFQERCCRLALRLFWENQKNIQTENTKCKEPLLPSFPVSDLKGLKKYRSRTGYKKLDA